MDNGTLYGISVGPGDPELITLKGLTCLQKSHIVAFPTGIGNKAGMAEQIVAPWLREAQHKLPLSFPYVLDDQVLLTAWQQAAEQVWYYLQRGEDVAFVCEGDVSFYSTFTYLAQTLENLHKDVQIQIIPGVSSPMAVSAVLGLPLTIGNQRLAVLPALYSISDLEKVLSWADVVVLLKVSSVYQQVWHILEQYNLLDLAWVVERATWPDQVIYGDLRSHPNLALSYFSLLVVEIK